MTAETDKKMPEISPQKAGLHRVTAIRHKRTIMQITTTKPGLILALMVTVTLLLGLLVAGIHVETSPENMFSGKDPIRIFQDKVRKEFHLHDMVLLGVSNTTNKNGVFNPTTLKKVYQISRFAAALNDPQNGDRLLAGDDIIAPDTVPIIEAAGLGRLRIRTLMARPPTTEKEALRIRDKALADPMLKGTMISDYGKSLLLYFPVSNLNSALYLQQQLAGKIAESTTGDDHFTITGLPPALNAAAETVLAWTLIIPAAALIIHALLMLVLFKNIRLVTAFLIVTCCPVVSISGLLIGSGRPLNMTTSMIPFIVLSVMTLYSIAILSTLRKRYHDTEKQTTAVMQTINYLFRPILFSSLISAAALVPLIFSHVPQLHTFGLFTTVGILLAWPAAVLGLPAAILLIQGNPAQDIADADNNQSKVYFLLDRLSARVTAISAARPLTVIGINLLFIILAGIGIMMSRVNINPMQWLHSSSEVRAAETALNQHFAGTNNAYLILSGTGETKSTTETAAWLSKTLDKRLKNFPVIREEALAEISEAVAENSTNKDLAKVLSLSWQREIDKLAADDDAGYEAWSRALDTLDRLRHQNQIFKRPDLLKYLLALQKYLTDDKIVGKSNSIADVVREVHQALFEGDPAHFSIPATANGVAQTLLAYRAGNNNDSLRHQITTDYTKANIWLQLKSGSNDEMEKIVTGVNRFMTENPPPVGLQARWAGPAYINTAARQTISTAVKKILLTCLPVLWIIAALVLRSLPWSIPVIIPSVSTIFITYGPLGLLGINGDILLIVPAVPALVIAVPLTVMLIHHYQTTATLPSRNKREGKKPAKETGHTIILAPAVLCCGSLPLLFAPLLPYQSAGILFIAALLYSGTATLWTIPALLTMLKQWLVNNRK